MTETANSQLKKLESQMSRIASAEVERRARAVLLAGSKGRNPARSFVMGMGGAHFNDKEGEPISCDWPRHRKMKWADPFYNFLERWDDMLHLTGSPMKIDGPDDPVITDW